MRLLYPYIHLKELILKEISPSSRKPPAPRTAPPAPQNPLHYRKGLLIFSGITVLAISGYSFYLYASLRRAFAEGANIEIPPDVSNRYNSIATTFDSSVDFTEKLMGLTRLRKKMIRQASGDVCEVSIGTGRNLTFYDWDFKGLNEAGNHQVKRGKVKSFTAVDKSPEMLQIAYEKFTREYPGMVGARWVIQDAAEPLPSLPVSANDGSGNKVRQKYDTIVQTMGLCSTSDPVLLLKNLGESVNEGGRILLLEHGKGTWSWLNDILDGLAPRHALEFGCIWNRDIGKIVEDSGLEIVTMKRKHFGTTWWIELRPRRRDRTETGKDMPGNKQ